MSFDFKSRITRHSSKLLACAITVLCLGAPAMAAQQVTINGSTTVLPVVQKAGEAFTLKIETQKFTNVGFIFNYQYLLTHSSHLSDAARVHRLIAPL